MLLNRALSRMPGVRNMGLFNWQYYIWIVGIVPSLLQFVFLGHLRGMHDEERKITVSMPD